MICLIIIYYMTMTSRLGLPVSDDLIRLVKEAHKRNEIESMNHKLHRPRSQEKNCAWYVNKLAKPHNTFLRYTIIEIKNRSRWNKNEWIRWSNKTNTTRDDPTSLYIIRTYIYYIYNNINYSCRTTVRTTTIVSVTPP